MQAGDLGYLFPWHLYHGVDGHRGGGQKEGAAAWNKEIFMLEHLPGRSVYRSSPPFELVLTRASLNINLVIRGNLMSDIINQTHDQ